MGLAQAMLHDPDILILDEPTSGLDPNQIVEIRELIKEVGREKTVILSTHILPEVQATCSRVIIISKGKVVADGTPDELRARERGGRYRVVVAANGVPADAIRDPAGQPDRRRHAASRSPARTGPTRFAIDATTSDDLRRSLFRAAVDNRWTLLELVRESASLEDVFRNLTTTVHPADRRRRIDHERHPGHHQARAAHATSTRPSRTSWSRCSCCWPGTCS